jgi:hypothetical protein
MPPAKHLTRREGIYCFRMRVPRKLLSHVGKKEIFCSLRTKDSAEAKRLSHVHSYNFLFYFAEWEKGLSTPTSTESNTFHLNFDFGSRTTEINRKEGIENVSPSIQKGA